MEKQLVLTVKDGSIRHRIDVTGYWFSKNLSPEQGLFYFERRKNMSRGTKKPSIFWDVVLTIITGGLWLIVLLIRFLKRNS